MGDGVRVWAWGESMGDGVREYGGGMGEGTSVKVVQLILG